MRRRLVVGLVLAVLGVAGPAGAAARWVTSEGSSAAIERADLALAVSPGWTTVWMSFDIDAEGASGALVLPLPLGAELDLVSDAWLGALESATAVRVLPPAVPAVPECGAPASLVHDTARSWSEPSVAPASIATFSAADELLDHAATQGWLLSAADVDQMARSDRATTFIALGYELPAHPITTQTVRLRTPGADPTLFLQALRRDTDPPLELTVWTFGPGRARLSGLRESSGEGVDVTWVSSRGTSDYPEQARALLESHRGWGALLECAGTDPIFSFTVLPGGGSIEPVARRYLTLASELGDTEAPVDACLAALWQARAAAISEIDDAALRCGGADELSHALTGLPAHEASVTRHRLLVDDDTPAETRVSWDEAPPQAPVVRAELLDVTGCVVSEPEVWHGGSGGAPSTGSGGSAPYVSATTSPPSEAESEVYTETSITCAGSSEPEPEPEWWESSDESWDDDDAATCSGDSTESSESGPETCAGDSSESDSGDETCSGDSSESPESESDTCAGDSTDYEDDYETCSVPRRRGRPPRLSALLLGSVAVLLPLRRRLRRRR